MLLLAHRGYHATAPENTLAAFAAAVDLAVDGIETDVRLSADRRLVIFHDRVSPRGRAVAQITHRELEQDAGYEVPLIEEILDAFPGVYWNVEIKTAAAGRAAIAVLSKYARTRRLLLSSFRHEVVAQCALELDVDCALLLAHRPLDAGAIIAGCAAYPRIRSAVWDYNALDASVLAETTAAGWKNYVYGPVTQAEHLHCAGLGLAGLITDYPRCVLAG